MELNRFLKLLKGQASSVTVSKQAFSQARQKLSEQTFVLLDDRLLDEFYTENTYTIWHGYRLIGKEVVIRTSDAFLKEVQEAIHAESDDQIIQIPIQTAKRPLPPKLKALKSDIDPEWVIPSEFLPSLWRMDGLSIC